MQLSLELSLYICRETHCPEPHSICSFYMQLSCRSTGRVLMISMRISTSRNINIEDLQYLKAAKQHHGFEMIAAVNHPSMRSHFRIYQIEKNWKNWKVSVIEAPQDSPPSSCIEVSVASPNPKWRSSKEPTLIQCRWPCSRTITRWYNGRDAIYRNRRWHRRTML